ncbi:hypothetical protein [Rhodococcus sp. NCIMB 12038]|uniref:hypothetical protein n=1 Tax=Rhodococcus sp. NCIMB 12038 TaxID=933800 RepID=UPI000B3D450C|nr:hypothetical protein [Rhodococcus sp. NCIMB 12038]OUS97420.1 hypothetical protein CA951_03505 [Rhodococcus sp. NCIMB 12038]
MTFARIQLFETDAEETARLAQAPVGSTNHSLSLLPVTNAHPDKHHLLELSWPQTRSCSGTTGGLGHERNGSHRMVVLPLNRHASAGEGLPRRHDGYWDCRIVSSDHPSYPVGGYDICVSDSELRRGRVLEV